MSVSSMKRIIKSLISVHETLFDIAQEKTEAIKIGDEKTVARLSKSEIPLIHQLQHLEKQRIGEVAKDLPDWKKDDVDPTFSEWESAVVSEADRPEWTSLYLELARSVVKLKQANLLNQDLLRQSIRWVKLNLNLLQPRHQPENYGNPHDRRKPDPGFSGRIDSRA
ncbi:flagellar protein FlgN [Sporolactobacillus shoreae]|uniref:Flagellar protein FlgN n=1 Tax=Sporolactobacillus shoreae TaxID=1465501 RepID=A0A4Z0GK56_9BACL|nr:flagellar protein FlgN [Sporolactobacillus shoreae]TGA95872.1 flagellar protein FlgN [Sporolactobacillus shoreae]